MFYAHYNIRILTYHHKCIHISFIIIYYAVYAPLRLDLKIISHCSLESFGTKVSRKCQFIFQSRQLLDSRYTQNSHQWRFHVLSKTVNTVLLTRYTLSIASVHESRCRLWWLINFHQGDHPTGSQTPPAVTDRHRPPHITFWRTPLPRPWFQA